MAPERALDELSDLQLSVIQALWDSPGASVEEVRDRLEKRDLATTTIATVLTRLEKRGLVHHTRDGRRFLYHASVARQDVVRQRVRGLLRQMFDDDPARFVAHLIEHRDLRTGDLDKIRELLGPQGSGKPRKRRKESS